MEKLPLSSTGKPMEETFTLPGVLQGQISKHREVQETREESSQIMFTFSMYWPYPLIEPWPLGYKTFATKLVLQQESSG